MFVIQMRSGQLFDVDALWPYIVSQFDRTANVGTAVATGVALGIRLALDEPGVAAAALLSYERQAAAGADAVPEETEVLMRELRDTLLAHMRRD